MAKVNTEQTPSATVSFTLRGAHHKAAVKWNTGREAAEQPQCIQGGPGAEPCPGALPSLRGTQGSQLHTGTQLVLPKLKLPLSSRKKPTTNPAQLVQALLWLCSVWSLRGNVAAGTGSCPEGCQVSSCRAGGTCGLLASCTAHCQASSSLILPENDPKSSAREGAGRDAPNPSGNISAPGSHSFSCWL